jgi:hypothetical protein
MAQVELQNEVGGGLATERRPTGKEKLEQIKAQVFVPRTKAQRVARALEALEKAVQPTHGDPRTLKYIAEHIDLEGF